MDDRKRSENIENLLISAQSYYHQALVMQENRNFSKARQLLLQSAEALFLAAQSSYGRLKISRQTLAEQIYAEAQDLKKQANTSPSSINVNPQKEKVNYQAEQSNSWLVLEKPDVKFDQIAGLESVKEEIRLKLLYPFQHPELALEYGITTGGGILLYGPPGTGKTMIGRAVAGEIEAAFFAIKPSEIMSQWVGVAEQNLQTLFATAEEYAVSVIFIDEIESLAPKRRSSHSTVMQRVVPQLLAEMDGFTKRKNTLLMMGATNEPWAIDNAILRPGRLDRLIYVAPPDQIARKKILEMNLLNKPLSPAVELEHLSQRTAGFSGADVVALSRRVCERVFLKAMKGEEIHLIQPADFERVLEELHSSIDQKDLTLFEKFSQRQLTS